MPKLKPTHPLRLPDLSLAAQTLFLERGPPKSPVRPPSPGGAVSPLLSPSSGMGQTPQTPPTTPNLIQTLTLSSPSNGRSPSRESPSKRSFVEVMQGAEGDDKELRDFFGSIRLKDNVSCPLPISKTTR